MAKIKITLSDEQIPEFISNIIDSFEYFLDDKGIVLENVERDTDEDLDPEEVANIYGSDYYMLEDEIKETLMWWDKNSKKK